MPLPTRSRGLSGSGRSSSRKAAVAVAAGCALLLLLVIGCGAGVPAGDATADGTSTVAAPGASSGAEGRDIRDENVRREGPPAAHIALDESGTAVTVDSCEEGCRQHAECVSWSWKRSMIEPENGLCMFSKVEGEQFPDPRSISGVIAGR